MAIRRFVALSFAAAAVTVGGAAPSAVAQQRHPSAPAAIHHGGSEGLILSADDFVLAPGETLVDGDPGLGIAPSPHPEMLDGHVLQGHDPLFHPGDELGIGMPCPSCEPGHYGIAEALYMQHSEDRRIIGDDSILRSEEFDYEWAGRLTVGRRFDCVNGYEVVYTGPLEWEIDQLATFPPVGGNTTTLDQSFDARFNSLEFNRTYFGWDVVKAIHGIRAILYEEQATFNRTTTPAAAAGDYFLSESVDNFLIGPQVGLELYYPLSNRFYFGGKLKGGLFANFADLDTRIDMPTTSRSSDDDVDIAGMFEIGTNLGFRVTQSITATIGYEAWYLGGVATSHHQAPSVIASRDIDADDDVIMHGATAGIHVNF